MSRFFTVGPALLALGAASVLVSPVAAQAASRAPATAAHASVTPQGSGGYDEDVFSGITYPDTQAGGAACQVQGEYLMSDPGSDVLGFTCLLNNPNVGLYNLWEVIYIGSCRYCIKGR